MLRVLHEDHSETPGSTYRNGCSELTIPSAGEGAGSQNTDACLVEVLTSSHSDNKTLFKNSHMSDHRTQHLALSVHLVQRKLRHTQVVGGCTQNPEPQQPPSPGEQHGTSMQYRSASLRKERGPDCWTRGTASELPGDSQTQAQVGLPRCCRITGTELTSGPQGGVGAAQVLGQGSSVWIRVIVVCWAIVETQSCTIKGVNFPVCTLYL